MSNSVQWQADYVIIRDGDLIKNLENLLTYYERSIHVNIHFKVFSIFEIIMKLWKAKIYEIDYETQK